MLAMDDTRHSSFYNAHQVSMTDVADFVSADQSASDSDDTQQNGSRKRKRPMNVTCEACKQRKVKCDRAQPSCGWCTKNDHVCEYKERKKPGLRAGYGRELESRLDRLEAIISEQGRQLTAHLQGTCAVSSTASGTLSDPEVIDLMTTETLNSQPTTRVGILGHSPAVRPQTIDPTLRDSSTANSHLSLHYAGLNATDDFAHRTQENQTPSAHSQPLTSPHSTATFQQAAQSLADNATPLPPYDLLYALVDLYFKHINVWLPLLDRKSTMDTFFGQSSPTDADKVLLHAMVATALRYSDDSRLTAESRYHFYSTSKQKVQLFGIESSSVRSLQALVILAVDVTGTTNGPPGWNLLSLISRSVVQLGLATEATSSLNAPGYPSIATLRAAVLPEPKSSIEDEERRRLFWSVFFLDRYTTVATAFEFALDEKEIDRRLPCRDDLFSANKAVETRYYRGNERNSYSNTVFGDTHGHFSYHCELLGILGRIHEFLKRPIDIRSVTDVEQWQSSYRTLDSELNGWHFSLPDDFSNITRMMKTNTTAKSSNWGWIMLHAAYNLTLIRLNSSAAYPAQTSAIFSSSYSAMQRCLSAVDNLKQLSYFVRNSIGLDKVGPSFAFAAWVAARVMLVHGSTMDHEVDPDVECFVSLLSDMGQYWDVATRYSSILSRVLEEYRTSQRAGVATMDALSTVKILADMRRCAFDLDFLISRQPSNGLRSVHPTRTNSPQPNELEYLDVFDLFNFPRAPIVHDSLDTSPPETNFGQAPRTGQLALTMPNFAVPNPDADWLFHQVP